MSPEELESLKHTLEHKSLHITFDEAKSLRGVIKKLAREIQSLRHHIENREREIEKLHATIASLQSNRSFLQFPSGTPKARKRKHESDFLADVIKAKTLEAPPEDCA